MRLALISAIALFAVTAHAGGSDASAADIDESDVLVITANNFDEKVLGSKFALVSESLMILITTSSHSRCLSWNIGRVLCTMVRSLQE